MTADDRDPAPPADSRPTVRESAVAELEALVRRIREMAEEHERLDRPGEDRIPHHEIARALRGLLEE